MSLYQKYRPLSFADVVGQDAVVTTLEEAAKQNKLAHAFLFAGGRGTGKTSVARILAKVIMTRTVTDEALQKKIIEGVENGSLVDLLEIDAASNRGIDDVRELIEKIQFSPVVAGAKVYIIDEAHMLTKEAFNALLKTLEEPPPYAYFILATTEINKIPATIQSRCQRFPFRSISEEEIIRRLQFIADQEHITIDREALRAVARHVDGGMRDAISLLDQMRSLSKITLKDIDERIGSAGSEFVEAVLQAIVDRDASVILETIQLIEEEGHALDVFLRRLLSAVRSALHKSIEKKEPIVDIQRMLETLLRAIRDSRNAPVPGLVVEAALLSLLSDPTEPMKGHTSTLLSGIEKKKPAAEKVTRAKAETKEEDAPIEPIEKEKVKPAVIVEARDVTIESVRAAWPEIVNAATPASVKMSLKNGRVVAVEGLTVTVGFTSAFHKSKVSSLEASRMIEETMEEIFKRHLRLVCIAAEGDAADATESSTEVNLAEAAAEIF
jgi:DNA polymerase-3 subunit gamma/tau